MSFSSCARRKGYHVWLLDPVPLPVAAALSLLLRVICMIIHTSHEANSGNKLTRSLFSLCLVWSRPEIHHTVCSKDSGWSFASCLLKSLEVKYFVDCHFLSFVFCPTGYYPCCPTEVGSASVKVELENISMDLLKLVELSLSCEDNTECISVASNTKGLQVLRFFILFPATAFSNSLF